MIHTKLFSKIISTFIVSIFMLALIGPVHAAPALTVDPDPVWNTFVGAASTDAASDIVVDANGNVYAVGTSQATWGSPVRAFGAGYEGFVAKFSPSGALLWNTFLGSASGGDQINGVALDGGGNVYVTGSSDVTWGTPINAYGVDVEDPPTTNPADTFVAKLDSSGNLIWNTFIDVTGEYDADYGLRLAVDGNGNIYTAGDVYVSAGQRGFAFKLNSSAALQWTKIFDSYPVDSSADIAVDGDQDVYFLGSSVSTWGTPIRPHDLFLDAYIAKLDPSDGAVIWNTFLGGNSLDRGAAMVIDPIGNIYVTGESDSSWGTPLRPYTSSTADAFVAKVTSSGGLVWNTFLGGSANDLGSGINLDTSGNVYISGTSLGGWGSPLPVYGGGGDGFIAKLNPSGSLVASTFLGSNSTVDLCGGDSAFGTAIDQDGNAYVIGTSASSWGSPLLPYVDCTDVFVAKVDFDYPTVVSSQPANANPTNASSLDFTVTFSESVTGVTADDFTLSITGVTGASISGVTGSGKVYTVTVNAGSGSGTIRLNVLDNDSILDVNLNPLGDTGAGNGNFTTGAAYTVDRISPAALSSVCMNQNPTSASSLSFAVTFTEAVTGVTVDDFSLFATGVSGQSVSGVSGAGSVYTVTVNAGSGNGTIRLDVNDNDSIVDLASNPLGGVSNGSFTNGVACTIKVISSLPSPVLRSPRNGAVLNDDQPTFQWSKVIGAQTYEIEFDTDSGFATPDVIAGINGTSYTAGSAFADDVPYFWHVRAVNTNGDPGKWSAVRTFTVDTMAPPVPTLIPFIIPTTRQHVLTFRWGPSSSAVLYEFVYDDASDCLSPNYSKTTRGTSIRPPAIPSGTYYWCVNAKDATGNWSGLSSSSTFTITP